MELLVVIGIISVLIAILMPALNRARQSAKYVACQSNLRQISTGFILYQQMNRNFFPPGAAPFSPTWDWDQTWTWDSNVQSYIEHTIYINSSGFMQIQGSGIWECPSMSQEEYGLGGDLPPNGRPGRGYGYNLSLQNWYSEVPVSLDTMPINSNRVRTPIIVIGDRYESCFFGIMQSCDLWLPSVSPPDPVLARHRDRINYLFSDWHVEALSTVDAQNATLWQVPP